MAAFIFPINRDRVWADTMIWPSAARQPIGGPLIGGSSTRPSTIRPSRVTPSRYPSVATAWLTLTLLRSICTLQRTPNWLHLGGEPFGPLQVLQAELGWVSISASSIIAASPDYETWCTGTQFCVCVCVCAVHVHQCTYLCAQCRYAHLCTDAHTR